MNTISDTTPTIIGKSIKTLPEKEVELMLPFHSLIIKMVLHQQYIHGQEHEEQAQNHAFVPRGQPGGMEMIAKHQIPFPLMASHIKNLVRFCSNDDPS